MQGGQKMYDLIDLTATRIDTVVQQQGTVSLSSLEYAIDASYNLIFLAVERLVAKGKLHIRKNDGEYIISLPVNDVEQRNQITA